MITKPKPGAPEQRATISASLRADESKFQISGIAAAYNVLSANLGGFREKIAPGAFSRSLRTNANVVCLFNHAADNICGRTKSGTLVLSDSPEGLRFTCQLDRTNSDHVNWYAAISRRDVDSCSFAFCVPAGGDSWQDADGTDGIFAIRTLLDVDLMDVSFVVYPAYPQGTSVDARQLALNATLEQANDEWRRRRVAIVGQLVEEDRRAALTPADVSSMEDWVSMRLEDALKIYGYRLADVNYQEGCCYGCNHNFDPDDVEGHDPDDCDCAARFNYQIKPDGSVELDNKNISAGHDKVWALKRSWDMPMRFCALLAELRQRKADKELQRRMRVASGRYTT